MDDFSSFTCPRSFHLCRRHSSRLEVSCKLEERTDYRRELICRGGVLVREIESVAGLSSLPGRSSVVVHGENSLVRIQRVHERNDRCSGSRNRLLQPRLSPVGLAGALLQDSIQDLLSFGVETGAERRPGSPPGER